jgi:DNA polymerase III sliding clamp (beta) subunit (PCNA family)
MKATIERAVLLKSLGHVQSVVERRNTIPILSNVLIEAREDGSIRLMATDLDLQVDESVPANVDQPGATTVSAHTLFDIVRKLPEGSQVEMTAAEGKMQVVAGRSRFNLSTLPRDDFPVIAEGDLPTSFQLPAATLRQIIEKTRAVKMAVDRDKVTLSVTSPENGVATEELPADYGADVIEIGFNAKYLLDILGEIDGDIVEVHLADAAAPTLLRENDKSNALYVLMPMRV